MIPECKALYLFLLTNGFKIDDLFCILYSTAKTREAYSILVAIAAELAYNSNGKIDTWDLIGRIDSFIDKYRLGCKMKMIDDFKTEKKNE